MSWVELRSRTNRVVVVVEVGGFVEISHTKLRCSFVIVSSSCCRRIGRVEDCGRRGTWRTSWIASSRAPCATWTHFFSTSFRTGRWTAARCTWHSTRWRADAHCSKVVHRLRRTAPWMSTCLTRPSWSRRTWTPTTTTSTCRRSVGALAGSCDYLSRASTRRTRRCGWGRCLAGWRRAPTATVTACRPGWRQAACSWRSADATWTMSA